MSKLTLEALKERSESVVSEDLLNSISGGTEGACHPQTPAELGEEVMNDPGVKLLQAIIDWF